MKKSSPLFLIAQKYLFSIFFICILLIPSVGYGVSGFKGKFAENFFGRKEMIFLANNTLYYVMKNRVFPGLIADGNGWLVFTGEDSLNDYQNTSLFTDEEKDRIKIRLNDLCDFLTKQNIEFVFVIPPNKNTIYPEYMPASIPLVNKVSRLDQIVKIWKDTGDCKLIDLRTELKQARQNGRIYYATDTHWNSVGAFIAYQAISTLLQERFPAIQTHPIEDFTLAHKIFYGDMTTSLFGQISQSEIAPELTPNYPASYVLIPTNARDLVTNSTTNKPLPTALVYRDSSFIALLPFLAEDFSHAQYLWTFRIDPKMIAETKPDIVILEMTERYLRELLHLPGRL